jgi:membrane-associated phospholipid phosphatase
MLVIICGAIGALGIVTIINHWWKISAHLTGIGGLLGGVCSFAMNYARLPLGMIIALLVVSLLLMYARIYLNAHSPMQVVCGFILGILAIFVPNFIMLYA